MATFDVTVKGRDYTVEADNPDDAWVKANQRHEMQQTFLTTQGIPGNKTYKLAQKVLSAAQGLTFNTMDEIVGAVAKLHGESYEKARDRVRDAAEQYHIQNPKTDLTLNVLGSLPTLWLPAGKVAEGAGKVKKAWGAIKPAMGYGAVSGAGASEGTTLGDVAKDATKGGITSGGISGGLNITGQILSGIGRNIMERIPEGAVMPMVAGGQVLKKVTDTLKLNSARQRLAQLLARDVEAKMPGTAANPYAVARARLNALGGRSPIAATGRNVGSELDLLASMPGSAETLAEREARRISTGRGPTLQAAASSALKEGQGLPGLTSDLIEQRRRDSEPFYNYINNLSVTVDKELKSLLNRSESAHGLAEITSKVSGKPLDLSKLNAENVVMNETRDALTNEIRRTFTVTKGSQVPFEALDRVKQALYDAGIAAKKAGHTNLGSEYDKLRRELINKLDSISPVDEQGNSIYKLARDHFAGPSALLEASKSGAEVLTFNTSELKELMKGMSSGELEAFRVGAAQAFKDKLGTQSGQTQLMSFTKNPNIQERIDLVFGKGSREFKKSLLQEAELKKLERAGHGSQTFKRQAGAEDQARTMEVMQDVGQAAAAPTTLLSKIPQWYGQLAMPEQTRNQLARLLLMRGPQAQQELNILEEYMRKKAGREKATRMGTVLAGRELQEK